MMQSGGKAAARAGAGSPDDKMLLSLALGHLNAGRSAQAEGICRDILTRTPKDSQALNLLGLIAHDNGHPDAAIKWLRRAVKADPRNPETHKNLAIVLEADGRREDAILHFKGAIGLGLDAEALIKANPSIAVALQRLDAPVAPRVIGELAGDLFLQCLLETRSVCDLDLEKLLAKMRSGFLEKSATSQNARHDHLDFYAALAQQCFINEYVWDCGSKELEFIAMLQRRLKDEPPDFASVIALACYSPLHAFPISETQARHVFTGLPESLVKLQWTQPRQEKEDAKTISVLTPIAMQSEAVLEQYEQNPYPRWSFGPPLEATSLGEFIKDSFSAARLQDMPNVKAPEFLIAGCGTGLQSTAAAERFPSAKILAVDISLPSLAYAMRKSHERQLRNITYMRGDILEMEGCGRAFDVVDSPGVLHHLNDPEAGWTILCSLLRPGGLMRIGLYSALARRSINVARDFIAENGFPPTGEGIRQARLALAARNDILSRTFSESLDFFSMSGCRDLLFNVVEHQFTIPRIRKFLAKNSLTFLGFEIGGNVTAQFRDFFGYDTPFDDLDRWEVFEERHPDTFAHMYIFWSQKAGK